MPKGKGTGLMMSVEAVIGYLCEKKLKAEKDVRVKG
jgi:hypothetical protein